MIVPTALAVLVSLEFAFAHYNASKPRWHNVSISGTELVKRHSHSVGANHTLVQRAVSQISDGQAQQEATSVVSTAENGAAAIMDPLSFRLVAQLAVESGLDQHSTGSNQTGQSSTTSNLVSTVLGLSGDDQSGGGRSGFSTGGSAGGSTGGSAGSSGSLDLTVIDLRDGISGQSDGG